MIAAFDRALSIERRMHGELAQPTCVDLTVLLARWASVCERYSYANWPDVTGLDPHVVFNELEMEPHEYGDDEFDLGALG